MRSIPAAANGSIGLAYDQSAVLGKMFGMRAHLPTGAGYLRPSRDMMLAKESWKREMKCEKS